MRKGLTVSVFMKSSLMLFLISFLMSPSLAADIFTASFTDPRELIAPGVEPSSGAAMPGFPEKLVFDVSWGIIGVGQATLEMSRMVDFNGRPAYEIQAVPIPGKTRAVAPLDHARRLRDRPQQPGRGSGAGRRSGGRTKAVPAGSR